RWDGSRPGGEACNSSNGSYTCCNPECEGKGCGEPDGCGGVCSSGSCPGNKMCLGGSCVCLGNCSGKSCGEDDGCGQPCAVANCANGGSCVNRSGSYQCCVPTCSAGGLCGESDGCGGLCNGLCPNVTEACIGGTCQCLGSCAGKGCGDDDGCGRPCYGPCGYGQMCAGG